MVLPSSGESSIPEQREALQRATESHRCLVVIDDVWDSEHGEQLAFIDPHSTTSKLLVTSRFSKLLEPCRVLMLELMDQVLP